MQRIEINKRTVGVNFGESGEAIINIWAPAAEKISLKINGQLLPLQPADFGYWHLTTNRLKPGDDYQLQVNEHGPQPDPYSLFQPLGVHKPSQAVDLSVFRSSKTEWKNHQLHDYIIYELHTGCFSEEGDFNGIENKLDYLLNLGVTAIEIMPVAQFPGQRNWGYDGVYPYAVQNSYGGPEGLFKLVEACHKKKLAVILDVVYNHFGPEGNYIGTLGPFFTDKYNTPWGAAINFDDAWCDGVRNYFIENALMWFRDFGIDALRLDAVHAIKDLGAVHFLQQLSDAVRKLEEAQGTTHYLVGEVDLNDPRFITATKDGGFGLDAQWVDEFHHALRVSTGQSQTGYYYDFNGTKDLAKSYRDAYVYDGQFSRHRNRFFGKPVTDGDSSRFVVFTQNHDHVGNRLLGERTSELVSFEMQKLMAAAVFVSPFLPMLFMGEEWSETNPFLYFVDHSDKELVKAVREGRKKEFAAFHIDQDAPDPFSRDTFLRSKLQWQLAEQGKHKLMLEYYKTLIALRKNHEAFKPGKLSDVSTLLHNGEQVIELRRKKGEEEICCFLNFSAVLQTVSHPGERREVLFHSADERWEGPGTPTISENSLQLKPESILILTVGN